MKFNRRKANDEYTQFKNKMFVNMLGIILIASIIMFIFYLLVWYNKGGNLVVSICQSFFHMSYDSAMRLYQNVFRNNKNYIWIISIASVFFVLLRFSFRSFARYFNSINEGIDSLLDDDDKEIQLPPEMLATERKLNAAKQTLKQRAITARLAEQRKNDLVMYLAHDIRTPLTSVIGYLNLLEEAPEMSTEQRARYIHITLDKAYHLEKMINEFFEITRYNLQKIDIKTEKIDLYYMLVQLADEISPILSEKGNTITIHSDENIIIYGDSDKLARVFNNVLKNAAAYSYPKTEITISAFQDNNAVVIAIKNSGRTIPREKLSTIFEKFYRLDDSRVSQTGGTGLGLAIAKEIVSLHGGTISADSELDTVTFTIKLPAINQEIKTLA